MRGFYNRLGTVIFKLTIYLLIVTFLFTAVITLIVKRYDITFETLLITSASAIALSQAFFSYANTVEFDLKKLVQSTGKRLLKVAIWLSATSLVLLLYILFNIYIATDEWYMGLIQILILILAAFNLVFAMTNMYATLQGMQKILFKEEDSEV